MTGDTGRAGDLDRELLAVLVALEPLDNRKWHYLDVRRRTFDAEGLLEQPLSSGERVLVHVAASLWHSGTVDLGYIACAIGGRHLQAIIDALAVRAGHELASHADNALARLLGPTSHSQLARETRRGTEHGWSLADPLPDRPRDGIEW